MELAGRRALVTGGKRRIGRGIATALAEAGCDVAINDLVLDADGEETLKRIEARGVRAAFHAADVTDPQQVAAMVDAVVDAFGGIDLLVNNPYWCEHRPFLEISPQAWSRTLDVCLTGYFLCAQAAARRMVEAGRGGAIVSIASVHADNVWAGDAAYGVAKAAIVRLTRSMAVELGPHGIRANAILPGYMDTEHEYGTPAPTPQTQTQEPPARATSALGRPSTPEDIGRAVAFLASPAAATITGVALPVDGGLLAW